MAISFLTNLNEEEFKNFLKQVLSEILNGQSAISQPDVTSVLDVKQAAYFLRLQVSTLYEKTSQKTIPHFKRGNKLYFNQDELKAWVEEGKIKTIHELQGEAVTYTMRKQSKRH